MSIKDLVITDQNVQSVYVQSQPDRLTGTAQQNKAVFDALPQLIRQRFNELLDALAGTGAAGEIPVGPIEGVTAENVQQALSAIQQNLTAYIDKIKSAVGASEVGVAPISGIEASNVQAVLQALRTIQSEIDQNVKKIMSEQGAATVGFSPVGGMVAQNVQQALTELRTAIDNIVSGIIPGGTIKAEMIDPAAIVQLGALLAVAAAAAYDPEGSYAVGDYCTHGGKLHKCGTPIESGEAWNAAHWTETTVVAELASKPQVRNLALQSGFTPNDSCTFFVTQDGAVHLGGGVSGLLPNIDVHIATMPADARPSQMCRRAVTANTGAGYFEIQPDGTVFVHIYADAVAVHCWFDITFVVGGE